MSEEQIRSYIIDKDSYDKNILVEAGAGAGKTRLIIQRVIGQIGAGIPVEKIVLITFTNAAANELYERIQAGLTENIAKCSGEEKKLYENAVMNLQRMKISTIHSFCLSMLSEQPFEADLHLGLKLAEDGETKQAQADFFERYYRTNGANIEDFGFLNSNQYKLRDSRVKNFLMETFLECAEYRDVEFVRDKSYDSVTFDTINKLAYKEMCNYRDSLVRAFYNGTLGGKYEDVAGFIVGDVTKFFPDNMNVYDPKYNYVKVCANLKACKKFLEPFNKTKIKKDHPKSNENMAIFSPSGFDNVKKENALYALNKTATYIEQAVKAYQESEDGESVSNDGLLYHTHKLLKNSIEARAFFKNKYSCIYIDEFQDTDVMQTELLLYLCADDSKLIAGGDIWQCPLRDGALFAVGDPKQSIYGFRDADIRLYNKMKAKFQNNNEKNCEFFSLDYNFRSDEQLIAWVNEKFQPEINGKYGMTYSDMISKADKPAAVSDDVIRGAYFVKDPGAESVAKIISDLVNCGKIFDKGVERPIRYSDFLLLLWNTTQMEFYSMVLTDRGIPYTMWGKRPQKNSLVLKRFIALAEFVFESYSPTAKEKAYSILWRCRPDSIDFEDAEIDVDDYEQNCESNDATLVAVKASADTDNEPIAKLYKILDFPELLFDNTSNREYELSNLIYLLEKWEKQDFAGSGELMDMMKNELSVLKEKELILDSSEQNCVRLMNLHKAKGLEGNIVIMAEAKNHKFSGGKYTDLVAKRQVYVPLKTSDYSYMDYLTFYPNERKQAEDKYFGEQLRLEYVAATRAKQAFIFVYTFERKKPVIDKLTMSKIGRELPQINNATAQSAVQAAQINVKDIFDEVNNSRNAFDESVKKLSEKYVSKITPSHLEDGKKVTIPSGVEKLSYKRPKGIDIGHMVHRAFELAVNMRGKLFPYNETPQQKELIQKIVSRAYLDFEDECSSQDSESFYKDYINYQLHSFLKDKDIEKLLKTAQAVYTELPFYSMDGNEYSNGVMDLVLKMSDKSFIIIDYKTNIQEEADRKLFEERILKTYRSQLDFYEKILRKMLSLSDKTKVECHIYFMNDDKYMKN